MLTTLQLQGANCSLCLNDTIDRLRAMDGINSVNSSIAEGCIAIDHDELTEADLVAWISEALHGVTMASNEIVMTGLDPSVAILRCEHGTHQSPTTPSDHP